MGHILKKDEYDILLQLAGRIKAASEMPAQNVKADLWKGCNKLKPKRPMVYADPQNGWDELIPETDLYCKDPFFRSIELELRKRVFRLDYIVDDLPVRDDFPVSINIHNSGFGIENKVINANVKKGAYHIVPEIKDYKDIAKLRSAVIEIDWESSTRKVKILEDIFGDMLKIRLTGKSFFRCGLTRILVHLRGLDQLMYDMYDNPEMLHDLMTFLQKEQIREMELLEKEGALSLNNSPDSITGSGGICFTDELPSKDYTGKVRLTDMTVWGESQETDCVGPEQFKEFVLDYQIPILNRFGLVDYGCCERLDQKIDLLKSKLPKLRWIAVSPWSDRNKIKDKISGEYVFVYKPNPALICSKNPDFSAAENQIRETINILEGAPLHIIMKDTSTFHHQLERIKKWTEMAVRIAKEMA